MSENSTPEINSEELATLLKRAEKAKSIKDAIDMLSAFDMAEQRRSIRFNSASIDHIGMRPDTEIVLSLVEIGRQEKLKSLKRELIEVLTPRAPLAEWSKSSEEDTHS